VVGFPAGGVTDATARLVGSKLGAALGQPVIVDNKPGAGGTLGTAAVAQAAPDGYTLLMGTTSSVSIAPHIYKKLPYDPGRDLVPIAIVVRVPQLLVVNPAFPARDFKSLIALLKSSPGKYDYASFGNGSSPHLTMELLKRSAGLEVTHVPYKGNAAASSDVIAGQVPMLFDTLGQSLAQVQAGKLRALAITTETRFGLAPDVPTFAELGHPQLGLTPWYRVFAPAGTPNAIVGRLAAEIRRGLDTPDTRALLLKQGAELVLLERPAARDFLDRESRQWGEAARLSGARLD
jgi:tripartite-type tricarboxylate transporter receptor subunit TctC